MFQDFLGFSWIYRIFFAIFSHFSRFFHDYQVFSRIFSVSFSYFSRFLGIFSIFHDFQDISGFVRDSWAFFCDFFHDFQVFSRIFCDFFFAIFRIFRHFFSISFSTARKIASIFHLFNNSGLFSIEFDKELCRCLEGGS